MTIKLAKDSIDMALVTNRLEEMTIFYRDVLGFEDCGQIATRSTPGGQVGQLKCGDSLIKLVLYSTPSVVQRAKGLGVMGYRYLTIHVTNLEEVVEACKSAGRPIVTPIKHISSQIRIAIVEDPDGNLVEFLSVD
jgi:catechol 2,3-dioxygenase-like lactoylglutathione lyase family enzyme